MGLPDPRTVRSDPPPRGHRYEWVPEPGDGYLAWRVVLPVDARPCRMLRVHGRKACGKPSVARMLRSQPPSDNWWHYCGNHLYGRIVHDGRVWAIHVVPDKGGEDRG